MSVSRAIELTEEFVDLAEAYREEFREIKASDNPSRAYQMKSRAKMRRKSIELSEALIELRKCSAFAEWVD